MNMIKIELINIIKILIINQKGINVMSAWTFEENWNLSAGRVKQ